MNMSREIKFRGKSKKTRKWLYGYLGESKFSILDYVYTDKVIFDNVLSFNTDNSTYVVKDLSVEEETIGQFTGLCDKNGNDIYEGDVVKAPLLDPIFFDIIKDKFCNAEIRFNKGSFVVSYYGSEYNIYLSDLNDKIRVIGNKYDNQELIEE
jgi:uncharacterized phage protein (TIGR01671 family)